MQITSVRQTEAACVETASRNRSVLLTGTGPSGVGGHRQVQPPHGPVMAMASHRAAPPHNTTHPGSRPVARNDRRPAATPAVHQLPDRTLRRPCRPTEAHALRVVHGAFGWGLCCSVAPGSVSAGRCIGGRRRGAQSANTKSCVLLPPLFRPSPSVFVRCLRCLGGTVAQRR